MSLQYEITKSIKKTTFLVADWDIEVDFVKKTLLINELASKQFYLDDVKEMKEFRDFLTAIIGELENV